MNFGQYNPYLQYNPATQYQQRIDNIQQWNGGVPQQSVPPDPQQNIICRPVASIEEARAIQTDFSGALMVFPDVSNGMIHTKRLDYNTGSAIFNTYRLESPPNATATEPVSPVVEYAPLSELEILKAKIAELETILTEKPKGKGAVEK